MEYLVRVLAPNVMGDIVSDGFQNSSSVWMTFELDTQLYCVV